MSTIMCNWWCDGSNDGDGDGGRCICRQPLAAIVPATFSANLFAVIQPAPAISVI